MVDFWPIGVLAFEMRYGLQPVLGRGYLLQCCIETPETETDCEGIATG